MQLSPFKRPLITLHFADGIFKETFLKIIINRDSEVIIFHPVCLFVITCDSEVIMFSPCVCVCVCLSVYVCHDVCPDDFTVMDW